MPSDSIDGYFRSPAKIEHAVNKMDSALDEAGYFVDSYGINEDMEYFIHVDLAQKHDRCVVAIAHVDHWLQKDYGSGMVEVQPTVIVDGIRTWTPSTDKLVNFVEVKDFIEGLAKRFNASLITFDRWNSVSMIEHFEGLGYESQVLSVGINHYHDLKMLVLDERVRIPYSEILIRELKELRIMPNGKLDHPRTGSKDIADAVCGAVFNAVKNTQRGSGELKVIVAGDMNKPAVIERQKKTIDPPPEQMPDGLSSWLSGFRAI